MHNCFIKLYNKMYNLLYLKKNKILYGKNLTINGRLNISGNISIGNNVTINSGKMYNKIGGQTNTFLITSNNGRIIIGDNVGISNSTVISHERVTIEDDVMIGGNCKIYDTDFHSIKYEHRIEKPDIHINKKKVLIKKGAFIGAHSIILKGVIIGEKSIVGAGSVVTKSIPDNEIWAGNPAKFIKKIEG